MAATRRGIVVAKTHPAHGETCLSVLSGGQLIRPIPEASFTPHFWQSEEAYLARVGSEVEFDLAHTEVPTRWPHRREDLPCSSLRRRGQQVPNLYKLLAPLAARSNTNAWPAEVMSPGSQRHLKPDIDVPSFLMVSGTITDIYELDDYKGSWLRADVELMGYRICNLPVTCESLRQAVDRTEVQDRPSVIILGAARPHNSVRARCRGQQECAIMIIGCVPEPHRELRSQAVHIGQVCMTDPDRGYSMVACPDVGCDQDVYVPGHVASPASLTIQEVVATQMRVNERGQLHACQPFWKLVGDMNDTNEYQFGENVGSISRRSASGCGYVECAVLNATSGHDVIIAGSIMDQFGLAVGDTIAFQLETTTHAALRVALPCWKRSCPEDYWLRQCEQLADRLHTSDVALASDSGRVSGSVPKSKTVVALSGKQDGAEITSGSFASCSLSRPRGIQRSSSQPRPSSQPIPRVMLNARWSSGSVPVPQPIAASVLQSRVPCEPEMQIKLDTGSSPNPLESSETVIGSMQPAFSDTKAGDSDSSDEVVQLRVPVTGSTGAEDVPEHAFAQRMHGCNVAAGAMASCALDSGGRAGGGLGSLVTDAGSSNFKTKVCTFFERGVCTRGAACTFAHGAQELRHHTKETFNNDVSVEMDRPGGLKTRMCSFFMRDACVHGSACPFAHGIHELHWVPVKVGQMVMSGRTCGWPQRAA